MLSHHQYRKRSGAKSDSGEVQMLRASFAYDNFDIQFKAAQPTFELNCMSFVSATSTTVIPLYGIDHNYFKQFTLIFRLHPFFEMMV